MKPRLLDLFCCSGGSSRGYQLAGFHVTGVDQDPQPNYAGDVFVQADALEYAVEHGREFDVVAGSPPCQANCALVKGNRMRGWADTHVDLIPWTRDVLNWIGRPYIIENVQGSSLRRDLTLCGEMFGLSVIRHRYFELGGWSMAKPVHIKHRGRVAGWRHGEWFDGPYFAVYGDGGGKGSIEQWQEAMGIHWTDVKHELTEAIPPAYTRYIGLSLIAQLEARKAVA